jgi:hypothetical protein
MDPKLRVISLGAGVQSTTMALMAAAGEIGPMPDCAIFADTGAEPEGVYKHLEWLTANLPFPVHIVSAGSIKDDILGSSGRTRFASIPFFIRKADGGQAMARRQCTSEYKITPIRRKVRELLGYAPRQRIPAGAAEVWIGISTDEIQRMKDSADKWQQHRWPLIETRMSRNDCLAWSAKRGFPKPPKSACTFCPYRDNSGWRDMRENDPVSFAEAIKVDEAIRDIGVHKKFIGTPYLHRSLKPLDQVDFSTAAERGQTEFGFVQECDGMCGV